MQGLLRRWPSFEWSSLSSSEPPAVLATHWAPLAEAMRVAMTDADGRLRPELKTALVRVDATDPAMIAYWDWWGFACGVGMVGACIGFTGPAAIGCGVVGAAWCASISGS